MAAPANSVSKHKKQYAARHSFYEWWRVGCSILKIKEVVAAAFNNFIIDGRVTLTIAIK